jgi:hypothetical protein
MRYLGFAALLVLVIVGFNLVWLGTSTVRIENASDVPFDAVGYRACEKTHLIGDLEPGQSAFRFLEACGDDTLEILLGQSSFCQIYVEGELYHVDALIRTSNAVECTYDDPFSSLFLVKALR